MVEEGWIVWDKKRKTLALTLPTNIEGEVSKGRRVHGVLTESLRVHGIWRVIYWDAPDKVQWPVVEDLELIIRVDRKDFRTTARHRRFIGDPRKLFQKYTPQIFAEIFRQLAELSPTK